MSVTAHELTDRVTRSTTTRLDPSTASMFLAYWLEHGIVEETAPGRYQLSERARREYSLLGAILDAEAAA